MMFEAANGRLDESWINALQRAQQALLRVGVSSA
jgi:hypothetical protein